MPDPALDALIINARHCLTWAAICQHYLKQQPKPEQRALFQDLQDAEQLALAELASILRKHDIRPGDLQIFEHLLQQAKARKSEETRLRFVQRGLAQALQWYQERIESADTSLRPTWQLLYDRLAPLAARCDGLLAQDNRQ